ncbi:MAG: HalOD1 output domain-containing protein [Haloarculaceae archaeon]
MSDSIVIEFGELSGPGRVSAAIVRGVAELRGCDPIELDFCLADHVDPDALDALFGENRTNSSTLQLTVDTDDFRVILTSDGYVTVSEPETAAGESQTAATI